MANGRTHAIATVLVAMCGAMQVPDNYAGAAWVVGGLAGLILSPDLDQIDSGLNRQGGYYGQYVLRETFPPIVERIFYKYWQGYARIFVHRSFWTHTPVIGTLLRLIYAMPYLIICYKLIPPVFAWALLALCCADILHWVMDWRAWGIIGLFRQ